jgi:hypothetical protein
MLYVSETAMHFNYILNSREFGRKITGLKINKHQVCPIRWDIFSACLKFFRG